ncbi:YkgJ family cysteine cluster protein [Pseudomonas putida]|uniref:YkgJ family cysteine cluster protein n=1 Tax=Pseudomonas putida TaxID=303 RepID=UPI003827299E
MVQTERCHIAVTLPQLEAQAIGVAIGKACQGGSPYTGDHLATVEKNFRSPCPFLKKRRCSIYADRPIACRVHFNLAQVSYFCDQATPG